MRIPTVGTQTVVVKVTVKDPSGEVTTLASRRIKKNRGFVAPIVKFAKPGSYIMTIFTGTNKKTLRIRVTPSLLKKSKTKPIMKRITSGPGRD